MSSAAQAAAAADNVILTFWTTSTMNQDMTDLIVAMHAQGVRRTHRSESSDKGARDHEANLTCLSSVDSVYGRSLAQSGHWSSPQGSLAKPRQIRSCQLTQLQCYYIRSLGFERCYVQCNPEPTGAHSTSVASKGSNNNIERFHGTLEDALARTLQLAVCETYECDLQTSHPIHRWIVRHANWLRERFEMTVNAVRHPTRTSSCSHITPGGNSTNLWKLAAHWGFGIWLGRSNSSDEDIVGTRMGCSTV
eukprot:2244544-Amphidinium_carterae.2